MQATSGDPSEKRIALRWLSFKPSSKKCVISTSLTGDGLAIPRRTSKSSFDPLTAGVLFVFYRHDQNFRRKSKDTIKYFRVRLGFHVAHECF